MDGEDFSSYPVLERSTLDGLREMGGQELVTGMATRFFAYAGDLMKDLLTALVEERLDSVERAAHSLKSGAGQLGGKRLFLLAAAIEEESRSASDSEVALKRIRVLAEGARRTLSDFEKSFQNEL